MPKLTEKTKAEILQSRLDLLGSGVPEEMMARLNADYAIALLENPRSEWFETPELISVTPKLREVFKLLDQLISDPTGNDAHLITEDLYSAYKAYKEK